MSVSLFLRFLPPSDWIVSLLGWTLFLLPLPNPNNLLGMLLFQAVCGTPDEVLHRCRVSEVPDDVVGVSRFPTYPSSSSSEDSSDEDGLSIGWSTSGVISNRIEAARFRSDWFLKKETVKCEKKERLTWKVTNRIHQMLLESELYI